MKRKLFFLIDKLHIRRSERIVLSIMMLITLILTAVITFIDLSPSPDRYDYSDLEQVFHERSAVQQAEHDAIMARYTPITPGQLAADESDTENDVKTYKNLEPEHAIADTNRININKADAEELQKLPGIGPAYATRIIEWREKNGDFESADQLLEIRGIGPARLENIRDLVVL